MLIVLAITGLIFDANRLSEFGDGIKNFRGSQAGGRLRRYTR